MLFQNRFEKYIFKTIGIIPKSKILLAVSGGIDSMVMLHLFRQSKIKVEVLHCNFKLRGKDADHDQELVVKECALYGITCHTCDFETWKYATGKKISIQMAARELRYEWFEKMRQQQGADYIATAHHADDNAETFLLNLIRGAGIAGLAGIPAKQGYVIRPLLCFNKTEITQMAKELNLKWRNDKSNDENKYLRNKIRNNIIPSFVSVNPKAVIHINNSSRQFAQANALLQEYIDSIRADISVRKSANEKTIHYNLKSIVHHPQLEFILFYILSDYGIRNQQLTKITSCALNGTRADFTSNNHKIEVRNYAISISKVEEAKHYLPLRISEKNQKFCYGNFEFVASFKTLNKPMLPKIMKAPKNIAYLDAEKLLFPLRVRMWKRGDAFCPLGMGGRMKKLSDFFVDLHLPAREKTEVPLLLSGTSIVWVAGMRIDERYKITSDTKKVMILRMKSITKK